MIRSGSTFSFNIARELLLRSGSAVTAFANSFGGVPLESSTHLILKSHAPDKSVTDEVKDGTLACICTVRKPEDAIASFMRAFGFSLEESISAVNAWLSWYSSVFKHVLTIEYEAIDEFPRNVISRIDEFLTGDTCDERSSALAEKYSKSDLKAKLDRLEQNSNTIDLGFTYYDSETFFHRRHISSITSHSASSSLSASEISRIRTELSAFIDAGGNFKRIFTSADGTIS
jgi:Sulfotransferase domain